MGNEGAGLLAVVGLVLGIYFLYCLYTIARSTYLTRKELEEVNGRLWANDKAAEQTNFLLRQLVALTEGAVGENRPLQWESSEPAMPPDPEAQAESSFTRATRGEAMWLPDPYAQSGLRWWDGEAWTDHTHD